jgi:hypothetical protein
MARIATDPVAGVFWAGRLGGQSREGIISVAACAAAMKNPQDGIGLAFGACPVGQGG